LRLILLSLEKIDREDIMIGQSKMRLLNVYIWEKPDFIELTNNQKLAYLYMITKASDIGLYQHSKKAMYYHIGIEYDISGIKEWINKASENVISIDEQTILFQWFCRERAKRGTKIKPNSSPELGKVREAIDSNVLDILINNGTFHEDCKYFEYGIKEGVIDNKSYSSKRKSGNEHSPYEEMLIEVKEHIKFKEGNGIPFERFTEGLNKATVNELNQKQNPDRITNRSQESKENSISDLAKGFTFEVADHLIEYEIEQTLIYVSESIEDAYQFMIEVKDNYLKNETENSWNGYIEYLYTNLE